MRKLVFWTVLTAIVMLGLPGLTVTFVKSNAAMAICFLLFFAVNPLYSVIAGACAGKKLRELWGLPIILAGLFLLGTWAFFDMGEPAFVLYAAVYLLLGLLATLISKIMNDKKNKDVKLMNMQENAQYGGV